MKRLALGILLLSLVNISVPAQDNLSAKDDAAMVSATVKDYIEAYYTGDARRMEQTLHPHYLKHMIHRTIPMREMTGLQILRIVRTNGSANIPQAERTEQVSVLDVAGNIASAKLVTPHWVDYLTLSKTERGWKILSVVQRIDN
ncbi:MAG: nuclear transport factor 2 family protein [Acidobacteria bacterium]|nr:nuclear transport factor 2 family protein [Acidobacteriota bacterium]